MDLSAYLRALRPHWVTIVALTIVGAAIAYGWALVQPRVYQADSSGVVQMVGGSGAGDEIVAQNLAMSKVASYVEFGSSRAVAQRAIEALGLETTPEELVSRISVTNPLDTTIIRVTAEAPTPVLARDIATAWIAGMVDQIDAVEVGDTGEDPYLTLVPIDTARLPSAPVSPRTSLAVALGALVGLALGIGYAVVRYALDRRIRSAQDVETEVGVPVIGRIPLNRALDGMDKDGQDAAAFGEAIRALRTNLQFMDVDSPPRVVVLTSPAPGDGKSTIAARLAASLAVSGRAVTLIDADLRRPTLAARLGLPEGAGLSDVLSGRAALEDVLHHAVGTPRLDVLTAGFIPPNPSEILGSDRMRELIDALASHSLVIIDAPPILAVTDAAILSNRADGAFVIASAGRTTYDLLERSVAVLTQANGRVLGVVVNRLSRRDRGTADYGYHYAYRAASTAPRQPVDEPVMGAKA